MNILLKSFLTCTVLHCFSPSAHPMAQPTEKSLPTASPQSPISGEIASRQFQDKIYYFIAGTDFAAYVDTKTIYLKTGSAAKKGKPPVKELRIVHTKYSHGVALTITFDRLKGPNEKSLHLTCDLSGETIDQLVFGEFTFKNRKTSVLCNELPNEQEFYWIIALLRLLPKITHDAFTWSQLKKHCNKQCFPTKDRTNEVTSNSKTPFVFELWDGLFSGAMLNSNGNGMDMFLFLADPELITDEHMVGNLIVTLPIGQELTIPLHKQQTTSTASARPTEQGRELLQLHKVNEDLVAEFLAAALDALEDDRFCYDESESEDDTSSSETEDTTRNE